MVNTVAVPKMTPCAHAPAHPWKLVAPWYRWTRAAHPADGRVSRPVIQKFAGTKFVEDFLADPQHSLVYEDEVDRVSNVVLLSAFDSEDTVDEPTLEDYTKNVRLSRLVPGQMRKLYLPVHDRFYLVVCELHCDVPGFPTASRNEACQAGFVVRRRRNLMPQAVQQAMPKMMKRLQRAHTRLGELRETTPLREDLSVKRAKRLEKMKAGGDYEAALSQAEAELAAVQAELQQAGIVQELQGWMPTLENGSQSKTLGKWEAVAAGTDTVASKEHFFPLYPLIPDVRNSKHDAAGRNLYYGVVPTTSLQHDESGRARFDDVETYEIHCFVRRHDPCCPKGGKQPDCKGQVVWSLPTEPYRLAPPFDALGSANRPITIKMPDLRELAALAAARPKGKLSPVRFIQPQHLSPKVKDGAASGGSSRDNVICFFSIPLITIIALFVLSLFLPIVVFIFQLWFLLVFRFCIKPEISFDADLDLAVQATPPSVDLDADFAIEVNGTALTALELSDDLKANLAGNLSNELEDLSDSDFDDFSNNSLGSLNQNFADNTDANHQDPEAPLPGIDYAELEYEPHREPEWKLEGGRG